MIDKVILEPTKILDAAAANGVGKAEQVASLRDLVLAVHSAGGANLTIKVQGSIQEDEPDWEAAQSATNSWEYVQLKDLNDASTVNGDTGITFSGVDDNRMLEVNTNYLRWLNVIVSGYVAGNVTVLLSGASNS